MVRVSHKLMTLVWGAVIASMVAGGCAFIQFEKGAYVVRDLTVVYSQQEDVTFLSWKLRDDANLNQASFELYRDGEYRTIDLEETFFPATPYECDGNRICFQYQLTGRYEPPSERSAIRTRHAERGLFAGEAADLQDVQTTFGLEPIAIDNNGAIEPRLVDWFANNDVPLRRDWQWQLVSANGTRRAPADCSAAGSDWRTMSGSRARGGGVDVNEGWVDAPRCLAFRPDGTGLIEAVVRVPMPTSAETVVTRQQYQPDRIDAPIHYGVLVDMSIQNSERCERVRSTMLETISQSIQRQGDPEKLGGYRPVSPDTGEALNGCNQVSGRTYPIEQMIQDAAEVDGRLAPQRVRTLFIYINNSPLPLSTELRSDLQSLAGQLGPSNDLDLATWAIGSSQVIQLASWDRRVGWRPIDSDTFIEDIESTAEANLPYATMDHEAERNIPIQPPDSETRTQRFKVCRSTPLPVRIGATAEPPAYDVSDPSVPWPEGGSPYFRVNFEPQILVPAAAYQTRQVSLVIEVCRRFCDHPFKTSGGGIYDSWSQTEAPRPLEVCKWQP